MTEPGATCIIFIPSGRHSIESTSLIFWTAALEDEYAPCQGVGLSEKISMDPMSGETLTYVSPTIEPVVSVRARISLKNAESTYIHDESTVSLCHDRNDGFAHAYH